MAQDSTSGPGGSVADIQSDALADNLGDADTVDDYRSADPDTPIEDEQQLVSSSDAIDSGTNDSDLGAEAAGLTQGVKGTDAGLDNSKSGGTSDRATGLGAFRD